MLGGKAPHLRLLFFPLCVYKRVFHLLDATPLHHHGHPEGFLLLFTVNVVQIRHTVLQYDAAFLALKPQSLARVQIDQRFGPHPRLKLLFVIPLDDGRHVEFFSLHDRPSRYARFLETELLILHALPLSSLRRVLVFVPLAPRGVVHARGCFLHLSFVEPFVRHTCRVPNATSTNRLFPVVRGRLVRLKKSLHARLKPWPLKTGGGARRSAGAGHDEAVFTISASLLICGIW